MAPQIDLIFGTGGWDFAGIDKVEEVVKILEKAGIKELDTARIYGESESVIGKLELHKKFIINTKAKAFLAPGLLSYDGVLESWKTSSEELKVDSVNIYLLHAPDPTTPVSETLRAIDKLHKEGKFKELGVSNFTAEQVQELYDHAKANNYILPTVYQGNYNPVARHIETILFPTLRKLGIRFHAYSAIAGGFLAKTADSIAAGGQGRWDPSSMVGDLYHKLYNKPKLLEGLKQWGQIAKENGVTGAELAYRYMAFHSLLKKETNDGIVLGATKPEQLQQTLGYLEKGPLSKEVVDKIQGVWDLVKDEAPTHNLDAFTPPQAS